MKVPVSNKRTALLAAASERILVLDGAMGTMIQGLEYDEAAFRGKRFKDFHRDVRGNNDLYFRYLDRVRARGIDIPIVPGIMPMHNFKQARNFVTRAGTSVPDWLAEKFEGLDDDPETRKLVAATVAAGQVQKLAKHGVDTFHFYTMNRADLVFAISHLLGIRPNGAQKAA